MALEEERWLLKRRGGSRGGEVAQEEERWLIEEERWLKRRKGGSRGGEVAH